MGAVKRFDPSRIQALSDDMARANADIGAVLEALDREAQSLRAGWSGEASAAYDRAHAQWTARLREMNRILALSSRSAGNAATRYGEAKRKIEERWA